jgi:hypothetical protein
MRRQRARPQLRRVHDRHADRLNGRKLRVRRQHLFGRRDDRCRSCGVSGRTRFGELRVIDQEPELSTTDHYLDDAMWVAALGGHSIRNGNFRADAVQSLVQRRNGPAAAARRENGKRRQEDHTGRDLASQQSPANLDERVSARHSYAICRG